MMGDWVTRFVTLLSQHIDRQVCISGCSVGVLAAYIVLHFQLTFSLYIWGHTYLDFISQLWSHSAAGGWVLFVWLLTR